MNIQKKFDQHLLRTLQILSSETCLLKKLDPLNEILLLLQNIDPADLKSFNENHFSVKELSESLIQIVTVKELRNIRDRDYEKSDFVGIAAAAEVVLKCIPPLLPYIGKETQSLVSVLMLCAAHIQDYLWSSPENVLLSKELVKRICDFCKFSTVHHLVASTIKAALEKLKPTIENGDWKCNPSSVHVFKWFLLHVMIPDLSPVFPQVLSFSLRLMDHYRCENKVHGIECIHHIVKNVPQAELLMYGRADVIYDALWKLTFERNEELVDVVYPTLLSFLQVTEKDFSKAIRPIKLSRFNDIYSGLLVNMAHEQRLKLRAAYSKQLPPFISALGIAVCCRLKRTVLVMCEYLITYDSVTEESRLSVLEALNCLVLVSWPRLAAHYPEILKSLLQLLYDTAMNSRPETAKHVKDNVICLATKCLINLRLANEKIFMDLVSDILRLEDPLPVVDIIRKTIEQPG